MRLAVLTVSLTVFLIHPSAAQPNNTNPDSLSSYLRFDESGSIDFLAAYFPPFFIQSGIELKSFIRSNLFLRLRRQYGDTRSVDAIYTRAMKITNDNTAVALLLSVIACFDHRIVGLKIPVFALFFPLSNESEIEFNRRVKNLPTKIYRDTPPTGDRDKLQHFFGSAFLSFVFESRQPAERIGDFIEEGEDAFIVDGALDERDMRANHQGQEFGLALLKNNHQLPSEFLTTNLARRQNDTTAKLNYVPHGQLDSTNRNGAIR